jgi:succinate-acetate transporter protein
MTHVQQMHDGRTQSADGSDYTFWRDHTHINLSPVAPPSILGLFGFAAATFMLAAHTAGWYGDTTTPVFLFPFALTFGGIAQLLAGMWAYRARDAVATAAHGTWGAFWIGFGIYMGFVAAGAMPGYWESPVAATAFGFWFVVLAAVTYSCSIAAFPDSFGISGVLFLLAVGSTLLAIGLPFGWSTVEVAGGIVLVASAVFAWYTATAMMLQAASGKVILPLGKPNKESNIPGEIPQQRMQYESGEPGVKVGQ